MTIEPDEHDCPIDGCDRRVPFQILMCKRHWRMVPNELRRQVYERWALGMGLGNEDWEEARSAAIATVEQKEAE